MPILKLLEESPIVDSFEVLRFSQWNSGAYVKLKIYIVDGTLLHVREYIDEKERHYSFHWQDENAGLICRWDNSWHHPYIQTHPHHKHERKEVKESHETSLKDILTCIQKTLGP